jgi:hypothetical protein
MTQKYLLNCNYLLRQTILTTRNQTQQTPQTRNKPKLILQIPQEKGYSYTRGFQQTAQIFRYASLPCKPAELSYCKLSRVEFYNLVSFLCWFFCIIFGFGWREVFCKVF